MSLVKGPGLPGRKEGRENIEMKKLISIDSPKKREQTDSKFSITLSLIFLLIHSPELKIKPALFR